MYLNIAQSQNSTFFNVLLSNYQEIHENLLIQIQQYTNKQKEAHIY